MDRQPQPSPQAGAAGGGGGVAHQEEEWMDVALTNQTIVDVNCAYKNNELLGIAMQQGFVPVEMRDFEKGLSLQPAKSYKFRVAAVNSLGVGPWSETTGYRTLTPGLPGAPNTVKVTKSGSGAVITWDAPNDSTAGTIKDFAVFLALNSGASKAPSFQRVYIGPNNTCHVNKAQLKNAMIDKTGGKPAIIFRIAARSERGFGPATQVRWLQTP